MEKNETKRIYPSQQLVCCLDSRVLKTFLWLCGWQKQGDIRLYVNQMSKFLHLTEEEVEKSIQTLEDIHLIDVKKVDQTFVANLNGEQVEKYFKIPLSKIAEGNGIPMADKVAWNQTEIVKPKSNNIEDMSDGEIESMILRLQASLNERKQVKSMVNNYQDVDGLPF